MEFLPAVSASLRVLNDSLIRRAPAFHSADSFYNIFSNRHFNCETLFFGQTRSRKLFRTRLMRDPRWRVLAASFQRFLNSPRALETGRPPSLCRCSCCCRYRLFFILLSRRIQPGAALQVSSHFQEVMEAVRRHDCSSFLCPQARPGNVFF